MKKHLLIDANNLLYRAHHVTKLFDKKGRRVSGVFNSIKMLQFYIRKFKPTNVIIIWDCEGGSKARKKIFPEYKAHRKKNRKKSDIRDILKQRKILQKIFSYLPFKNLEVEGIEADDIIGWLATEKLKGKKIIVSNDHDFFQLIDKKIKMYYPNKKKLLTINNIDNHLGFPLKHYILWKSMVGDASDNIKGIPGIGTAKATKIILNGLTSKKKMPITSKEMEILNACKYLIAIGAVLTKKDIKEIKKAYKKEKVVRKFKYGKVRERFVKHGFISLLYGYEEWLYIIKKLEWGK